MNHALDTPDEEKKEYDKKLLQALLAAAEGDNEKLEGLLAGEWYYETTYVSIIEAPWHVRSECGEVKSEDSEDTL